MRPPVAAAPSAQALADTIARIESALRRTRTGTTGRGRVAVRLGGWRLIDRDGTLVAVHDDGRTTILAGDGDV